MPFICLARTDIPDSTLQVTDLWPNKSQTNPVIDPPAVGPLYINAVTTATVTLSGAFAFTKAIAGLAAYLVANVQALGAGGAALTPTQANAAAAAIITRMRSGLPLALANINTVLVAAAGALTELTDAGGSASTGVVSDVLRILAGIAYTVPAGTDVETAGVFAPQAGAAAWNAANFADHKDILPTDSSFYQSLAYGKIAGFKAATFSYVGVTGAAITVYDDAGGAY